MSTKNVFVGLFMVFGFLLMSGVAHADSRQLLAQLTSPNANPADVLSLEADNQLMISSQQNARRGNPKPDNNNGTPSCNRGKGMQDPNHACASPN